MINKQIQKLAEILNWALQIPDRQDDAQAIIDSAHQAVQKIVEQEMVRRVTVVHTVH